MSSTTTNPALSPVHGGLAKPVDRWVDDHLYRSQWQSLPRIEVGETDRTTLGRIADGTLSPLCGPMDRADYESVLTTGAIERDGKKWAWTIPIVLPVTADEARLCRKGAQLALSADGEPFGQITVSDCWEWDKPRFVESVYLTGRSDHPGARLWNQDSRTHLVGGEISLQKSADPRPFAARILGPAKTRARILEKGYERTVAFQTRNPLHRAHEYALVYGAEQVLAQSGARTGVILNPLVGQLKGDDVPAVTRMETYEKLVTGRFLGQGDMREELWRSKGQDLNDQLELIGLDMRMYYGGPKEAVMHSIYRQNMGFTHFIVGRKHADAPFDDKSSIWGDFDAQEIFKNLGGALSIQTVNVGFAAYFEEIGRVGLVEEHKDKTMVSISGTKMRELLGSGQMPDERVMRPSTAQVLMQYYAKNA